MSLDTDIFKEAKVLSKTVKELIPGKVTRLENIKDYNYRIATQQVVTKYNIPYYCDLHKTVHAPKTKIWSNDMSHYLAIESIPQQLIKKIEEIKKQRDIESEARIKMYREEKHLELNTELERAKKEEFDSEGYRYFFYDITSGYEFRPIGKFGGYRTKQELLDDQKYALERIKEGKQFGIIVKGKIDEVLKGE